jgi:hypothetical protein
MSATRVVGTNLGVAVVATKGTGLWEYRPAGATAWTTVGTVSALKALFLNATDEVRFTAAATAVPQTARLSFKAWDKTKVAPGTRGPAAGPSVSKQTEVLTVAVGNTRPALNTAPAVALPPVSSSSPVPSAGVTVKTLLGTAVTDTPNALKGIAVTAAENTNGKWQYALGTVFADLGPVGPGSALLLPDTAKIRFVPNSGFAGTATISYKAWDRTAGQSGDRIDTAASLDSFSPQVETASITVTA